MDYRGKHAGYWVFAVLIAAGASNLACGRSPDTGPPHIILITLDTVRRDHVGPHVDQGTSLTPNLDAFASSAVVFEDAWSPIPFTLPSNISMLTGLYPDVHRVDREDTYLNKSLPTLSELLTARGYRSIGLTTNRWMKGQFGFARGFEHYETLSAALTAANRVNARLFELLEGREENRQPLFLLLHYIDAHSDPTFGGKNTLPYYAPPELLTGFVPEIDRLEFCTGGTRCATTFLLDANRDTRRLTDETVERIATLYARGIQYLDRELGVLFQGLQESGLWDDAVVVITSDHGEEFREHGQFIHIQPYVENLAIPLMIKLPGQASAGTRLSGIAETVDLMPTLLDIAGIDVPPYLQGKSLLPMITTRRPVRQYALGSDKAKRHRFSLRTEGYTLIHNVKTGASQLFDRANDPGELREVGQDHPELLAAMRAQLLEMVAANRALGAELKTTGRLGHTILSQEEQEELRAIGYLP